ncbi:MAG: VIT1/CCC1 transporter family protein [Candidatus Magasanikbacteria bacterium]|jgi:VIT1/CCC1 family predicted Fe2+/Mn2+ transporter|nr:VIT1/CCC1 transporter family protein [Candidatus Magasanikbacteria bacterium]
MSVHKRSDFIHHQKAGVQESMREFVFGMEDGMVSTFGAVTGIALATQDPFTILLTGSVLIAVESISMGVGSYLSNKSVYAIDARMLAEEQQEIDEFPKEEKQELIDMYIRDGWSKPVAINMAEEASQNKKLFLQEMAFRELRVVPNQEVQPVRNGIIMGISYVVGGLIPLVPYVLFQTVSGVVLSAGLTAIGLFLLGVVVASYSKRSWVRSGSEMLILAGIAAGVGYAVGQIIDRWVV